MELKINHHQQKKQILIVPDKTGTEKLTPKIITLKGMEFVHVPGGEFDMGDVFDEGYEEDKPVHKVRLDDFYLGKYAVTFDQYDTFCDATGQDKPDFEDWGRGSRPATNVSWENAAAFCEWMSKETGEKLTLPTEAQWEYAARECGKKVRFGNGKDVADPRDMNFDATEKCKEDYSVVGEYRKKTVSVGTFAPNALGLHEMSGNVWDWCLDWYDEDYYKRSPSENPRGPSSGEYRVLRGGSCGSGPRVCRCTDRFGSDPDSRVSGWGFRLARTAF